jgi:hypothetical protein
MLARLLRSRGVYVIEDARASKRDNFAPTSVTVKYETGEVSDLINSAASASPAPVALVTEMGRVFVLSSGGSGEILVVGASTPEQDAAVLSVMDVLHDVWGVKQAAPKKARKADDPVEPVSVAEAESLVDSVTVLDAIIDGGYDNA